MGQNEAHSVPEVAVVQDALVISAVCFVRQSLVEILGRLAGVRACGEAATAEQALERVRSDVPALVLLDAAFPQGIVLAGRIGIALPGVNLIALGVRETETEVLAWAEAGVAGCPEYRLDRGPHRLDRPDQPGRADVPVTHRR